MYSSYKKLICDCFYFIYLSQLTVRFTWINISTQEIRRIFTLYANNRREQPEFILNLYISSNGLCIRPVVNAYIYFSYAVRL